MMIRPATKSDASDILSLLYELGRPKAKTKLQREKFEKQIILYTRQKQIAIAETDSVICGMISMILVPRLNQTKLEMYIPELIVSSKYQKIGIGKALIDHAIAVAKKKNCYRIRLESGHARKESHKFYSHLGFEQYAKTFKLELR